MNLSSVRSGDIILADRKGRQFFAVVVGKVGRELDVRPIDSRISYYSVSAREVIGHWSKSKRSVEAR